MQKKSETYSKFCEFKALVEKESGKKVKALRSDNGGEYISSEFKDFYSTEGIQRELIAPHNPQQNDVAERKNGRSWVLHGRCCMIRAYPFTCGRKHAIQQYMCRTVVLTGYFA